MNEFSLNDPRLHALEATLAASAPRLSPAEAQQLLYACAFSAGKTSARRSVRRWQFGAAMTTLLLLAVTAIRLSDRPAETARRAAPFVPAEIRLSPVPELPAVTRTDRDVVTLELGAWQVEDSPIDALSRELEQFASAGLHVRSQSVSALARSNLDL